MTDILKLEESVEVFMESPTGVVNDLGFMRRSQRNPNDAQLTRSDIKRVCEKIRRFAY